LIDTRGVVIDATKRRHARPSKAQLLARRNFDWLHDYEIGRPDPQTGLIEPRPVWLIAALAGVTPRAVRAGLAEARKLREAISREQARLDS
jgi:hypothetical protein